MVSARITIEAAFLCCEGCFFVIVIAIVIVVVVVIVFVLFGFGFISFVFVFVFVCLFETGFLCSPDCPGTHSVGQAGLKLRNLPAFAFNVLGIKGVSQHHPSFLFCFVLVWIFWLFVC